MIIRNEETEFGKKTWESVDKCADKAPDWVKEKFKIEGDKKNINPMKTVKSVDMPTNAEYKKRKEGLNMNCIKEKCSYYIMHMFHTSYFVCNISGVSFTEDSELECCLPDIIKEREQEIDKLKGYYMRFIGNK